MLTVAHWMWALVTSAFCVILASWTHNPIIADHKLLVLGRSRTTQQVRDKIEEAARVHGKGPSPDATWYHRNDRPDKDSRWPAVHDLCVNSASEVSSGSKATSVSTASDLCLPVPGQEHNHQALWRPTRGLQTHQQHRCIGLVQNSGVFA